MKPQTNFQTVWTFGSKNRGYSVVRVLEWLVQIIMLHLVVQYESEFDAGSLPQKYIFW